MSLRLQTALVAALWLGAGIAAGANAQRPPRTTDTYGYESASGPACAHDFVDIGSTGATLSLEASSSEPAMDDGAGLLGLAEPFELYGHSHSALVVSSNGYLAAADSLAREDGGDFSNDCAVPAIPSHAPASAGRILALHDDLRGDLTGGQLLHQHFETCPRPSEALGAESCTVVEWHDWTDASGESVFDFQVLLYHRSHQIVLQYGDLDGFDTSDSTVGLQNSTATVGLLSACGGLQPPTSQESRCFYDPRFPRSGRSADLAITISDKRDAVLAGGSTTYLVLVENAGPSRVEQGRLQVPLPEELESCDWRCVAAEDGACSAAAGSGTLDDVFSLAPGGTLTWELECQLAETASETVVVEAAVSTGTAVVDPTAGNDVASDSDAVVSLEIFDDGFEAGSTDAWSSVVGLD